MSLLWMSVFNLALTVGASYAVIKSSLEVLMRAILKSPALSYEKQIEHGPRCWRTPINSAKGTLTFEAVYKVRDQFAGLVREVAAPDVGRMGIEILSFTIKDVYDDV